MTKFVADHPAFQRMERFVQEQVQKCRPSAANIALRRVALMGLEYGSPGFIERVNALVAQQERRMTNKLRRYYGLTGKYVGH